MLVEWQCPTCGTTVHVSGAARVTHPCPATPYPHTETTFERVAR